MPIVVHHLWPAVFLLGCGSRTPLDSRGQALNVSADPIPIPNRQPQSCGTLPTAGESLWSKLVKPRFLVGSSTVAADYQGNALLELEESGEYLGRGRRSIMQVDLMKLDAAGDAEWNVFVGTEDASAPRGALSSDSQGNAVVLTPHSSDLPLAGTSSGNGIASQQPALTKVARDGTVAWSQIPAKEGQGSWDVGALAIDDGGNLLVQGLALGAVDMGGGLLPTSKRDLFVAKLDANGHHVWSRALGGPVTDIDLAVQPGGDFVVAGTFSGAMTFGTASFDSSVDDELFFAGLDGAGNTRFAQVLRADRASQFRDLTGDAQGNSYLAAKFDETLDLGETTLRAPQPNTTFVVKYDSTGTVVWSHLIGILSSIALATSPDRKLVIAGTFQGAIDLGAGPVVAQGPETFVVKLEPGGNPVWLRRFNGSPEFVPSVAVDKCGGVLVAGAFQGSFDTGTEILGTNPQSPNLAPGAAPPGDRRAVTMLLAP